MDLARSAEERQAWDEALSIVSPIAECDSHDYLRHDAHLWHMDLLAQAGRLDELGVLAESDRHARRQLDRALYACGQDSELRNRAARGDEYASLLLAHALYARFVRSDNCEPELGLLRPDRAVPVAGAEVLGISSSGRTCPFRAVLRGARHAFRLVPLGAVW